MNRLYPCPFTMGPGLKGERETLMNFAAHRARLGSVRASSEGWKLGMSPRQWTEGWAKVSETSFFIFLGVLPHQHPALCLLARCSSLLPLPVSSSCRGHRIFHWVAWGQRDSSPLLLGVARHAGCSCCWTADVQKAGRAVSGESTCVPLHWSLRGPQRLSGFLI